MPDIYFGTTNKGKINEARAILKRDIIGTSLEIDEIQSLDPILVASKKAREYFRELKMPVFIEDIGLSFSALNGLPGTYINDFYDALGNQGLIDLLKEENNRKASAICTICFIDKAEIEHIFQGEIAGTISTKLRGDLGWGWDPIFIPDGSEKTFGEMEMDEKNKYSMRGLSFEKFKKYLDKVD